MDEIHVWGINCIHFLQTRLHNLSDFFILLSLVGDPCYLYIFYFPVMSALDNMVGLKLLQAAAVGEWLNLLLKWIFNGERPYWWAPQIDSTKDIHIEQYFNTCETGPGTPSGHLMVTGAAWYIVVAFLAKIARSPSYSRKDLVLGIWYLYGVGMILLGISRVYIAAHFPHQCIGGLIGGVFIGKFINDQPLYRLSLKYHFYTFVAMIASLGTLYIYMNWAEIDPSWSVALAKQWCSRSEWVHLVTAPYFVMWRFVGTTVGFIAVFFNPFVWKLSRTKVPMILKIAICLAGVCAANMFYNLGKLQIHENLMYFWIFFVYLTMTYTVAVVLPRIILLLWSVPVKEKLEHEG